MPAAPGSIDSRLRRIQTALGVHVDGVLGPQTLTAIEALLKVEPPARATSLVCSSDSLAQICAFEVSSKAAYEKKFRRPVWPGGQSGVTIGIGYDIGVTARKQIEADWRPHLNDVEVDALLIAQGVTGEPAKKLAKGLSAIGISYELAEKVFYQSTLPRFAKMAREVYPGLQDLPADAQGMLLSLIYNRGTSLSGERRREMAAIKPLVKAGDLGGIADQVEAMVRLWPDLPGLQERRRREANIIRAAKRRYADEELVSV